MYSVIQFAGFQHKVTVGETVKLSKLDAEVGSDLKISEILLVANGDKIEVGAPHVPNSSVTCEVLSHGKDDKIKVFKRKRRKGYRLTAGHRQQYTEVLVKEIASDSGKDSVNKKYIDRVKSRVTALANQKIGLSKKVAEKPVVEAKTEEPETAKPAATKQSKPAKATKAVKETKTTKKSKEPEE